MMRLVVRATAILASCALVVGCGDTSSDHQKLQTAVILDTTQEAPSVPPPEISPDSLRDDLVQHGLLVPTGTRMEVLARLGQPDSARSHAVANRHNPAQTDSIVELFYPGLRLEYLVVRSAETSEFLDHADVWSNRHLKYPSLGVGAYADEIIGALGNPLEHTGTTLRYDCGNCLGADSPVVFHFEENRVRRITYQFYVD